MVIFHSYVKLPEGIFGDLLFYLRKVTPTAPPTTCGPCGLWWFFTLRPCRWLQRRTAAEIPGHVRWVHDLGVFVVYGGCLGLFGDYWASFSMFCFFFWWGIKHQSTWKSACKQIGDSPHEFRTYPRHDGWTLLIKVIKQSGGMACRSLESVHCKMLK